MRYITQGEGNTARGIAEYCIFHQDKGPSVIYLLLSSWDSLECHKQAVKHVDGQRQKR